jgi:hypothetical protein
LKKKIAVTTLLTLTLATLSACTVEAPKETVVKKEDKKVSNEDLSNFVYQNKNEPLYYSGTLNYVHSMTVKEINEIKEGKEIVSEISLYDLEEMAELEEKDFYKQILKYNIEKDSMTEQLEQADYDDPKNFVTNKVVLKTPLKEGNVWEQEVRLADEKNYKAKTKIEKVIGEKGERKVFTVTIIKGEGFEDYPNKEYQEKSVYQEGKGLISFERFYPNEDGGFIFEYHVDKKQNEEQK